MILLFMNFENKNYKYIFFNNFIFVIIIIIYALFNQGEDKLDKNLN